jgi:hypothetical protein
MSLGGTQMVKLKDSVSEEICIACNKNNVFIRAFKLCHACYLKARKQGIISLAGTKIYDKIKCQMPRCQNTVTKKSKTGLCKKCYRRLHSRVDVERCLKMSRQRRKWALKSTYGLTEEQYNEMYF